LRPRTPAWCSPAPLPSRPDGRTRSGLDGRETIAAPPSPYLTLGEKRRAHEIPVATAGSQASVGDGPHDERCSPGRVACREDTGHIGREVFGHAKIACCVTSHTQLLDHAQRRRSLKADRQHDDVGVEAGFAAGDGLETPASLLTLDVDAHSVHTLHRTVIATEARDHDCEIA